MSIKTSQICQFLSEQFPKSLAEEWDNVGLLIGDASREIESIMTCLTITPEVVEEAVAKKVNFIFTHHPLPFKGLKKITQQSYEGKMILKLIEQRIQVFSSHTAYDSAMEGINQQTAEGLGLQDIKPLEQSELEDCGAGRLGTLPEGLDFDKFAHQVRSFFSGSKLKLVGHPKKQVKKVAIACGAAGMMLAKAHRMGADALILGETNYHTCLQAKGLGVQLILTGHFHSERFAMESVAEMIQSQFKSINCFASQEDKDPVWSFE